MTNTLIAATPSRDEERRARFRPALVLLAGFVVVSLGREAALHLSETTAAAVAEGFRRRLL